MTQIVEPNGSVLAVRDMAGDLAPRMVLSLSDLRDNLRLLEEFKREIMVPDVDYGTIPGTPKPTLLKPGAEKLTIAFALTPVFEHANRIEDWDRGFFHYEERCTLTSRRSNQIIATANGSANSREARYRLRKAERVCPNCGIAAIIKGKAEYGGGWLCFKKKGGCGTKFVASDPEIVSQVVGNIDNPEPWDLANTILKMAQKRALVAAVLIATGGSGIWTQDLEDLPAESRANADVIDVSPEDELAPEPEPEVEMVRSADSRIWKRWEELKGQAEGLGIRVSELRLPVPKETLANRGQRLFEAIEDRKRQLAAEDGERAAGKAEHETRAAPVPPEAAAAQQGRGESDSPTDSPRRPADEPVVARKDHPLWKEWLEIERRARVAELPNDPLAGVSVHLPIGESELREYIALLNAAIDNAAAARPETLA